MGHERLGILPRTRRWEEISKLISEYDGNDFIVKEICKKTIKNVRDRFRFIENDDAVYSSFQFLVALSVASRYSDPSQFSEKLNLELPPNPTPLSIVNSMKKWITTKINSNEYSEIAVSAASDALTHWYRENTTKQEGLFPKLKDPYEPWRSAGNGSGFCELSRLFFSKFTERYINYFLDREASIFLNIEHRDRFKNSISTNIKEISKHAFETAKITQSFSAGWYNKHVKEVSGLPPKDSLHNFLRYSFEKMREELLRESE
jgi:hypothetical protein